MYAALAGWAAGEAWCGGVWIDGLCVQRVQWCAGDSRVWLVSSVVVVYQNTVVKTPHPLLYNYP